ncbi:GNAT family N-acetyltransferase [Arthrobacter castelli]|uniref:GNAT family N-acetyltransferase n=1 Tax=Arthrobacter castelli TaxID=271431 RepID=UPI00055C885E|nr:GNAT family N-acetyltransferase [Arthrobacter castelli]
MTRAASHEIADNWKYPVPFDFYDATADPEDYEEFVTCDLWPEVFQQVRFRGALIGFFAAQPVRDGAAYEINLGLRPDLTGKGAGPSFLNAVLTWLGAHGYPLRTVLSVAAFNTRAIKAYQAAGFTIVREFPQETNGGVHDFIEMERGLPDLG